MEDTNTDLAYDWAIRSSLLSDAQSEQQANVQIDQTAMQFSIQMEHDRALQEALIASMGVYTPHEEADEKVTEIFEKFQHFRQQPATVPVANDETVVEMDDAVTVLNDDAVVEVAADAAAIPEVTDEADTLVDNTTSETDSTQEASSSQASSSQASSSQASSSQASSSQASSGQASSTLITDDEHHDAEPDGDVVCARDDAVALRLQQDEEFEQARAADLQKLTTRQIANAAQVEARYFQEQQNELFQHAHDRSEWIKLRLNFPHNVMIIPVQKTMCMQEIQKFIRNYLLQLDGHDQAKPVSIFTGVAREKKQWHWHKTLLENGFNCNSVIHIKW